MGLRSTVADLILLARYGTRYPCAVHLPGGPVPLEINPKDRRARNLIARRAARGRISTARRLWIDAVAHVQPDLALDVGTNYGECLLGVRYAPRTQALGLEANPALLPLIQTTLARHPDRERIRLVHGLASDTDGEDAILHVDPSFSGTASAVASAPDRLSQRVPVRSLRLDTMIAEQHLCHGIDSIVFKIDIEGFEGVAMRGFTRLNTIPDRLGILEFDLQYLAASPVDGPTLLERLLDHGTVFDSKLGVRHLRRITSMEELLRLHDSKGQELHTDLVVASSATLLPPSWRVR